MRDALGMLRDVRSQPRFLLAADGEVRVGFGIHRRLEESGPEPLQVIGHAARQLPKDATVMGGFAFDMQTPPTSPWAGFPRALFVVPSLEWVWREDEWSEHRNGPSARMPDVAETDAGPDEGDWRTQVGAALDAIRSGRLEKVVLARSRKAPPLPDALEAFGRLAETEPDAHLFFFEPHPGHAFFGATPERLARLRDGRLETHAVAGTAQRGDSATDARLGQRLLGAGKESHEHRLVVEHIVQRLQDLGLNPEQGMRRLRKMAKVQHLETQIAATATAGLHVLDVAAALHPTPAVCGTPKEAAMQEIARLEAQPRGWYSGGIGWFNQKGEGEILMALRAALATPQATWLYAGAGITEGSDAEAEFQETEDKMRGLVEAVAV